MLHVHIFRVVKIITFCLPLSDFLAAIPYQPWQLATVSLIQLGSA